MPKNAGENVTRTTAYNFDFKFLILSEISLDVRIRVYEFRLSAFYELLIKVKI
jgi:hypothetical protein